MQNNYVEAEQQTSYFSFTPSTNRNLIKLPGIRMQSLLTVVYVFAEVCSNNQTCRPSCQIMMSVQILFWYTRLNQKPRVTFLRSMKWLMIASMKLSNDNLQFALVTIGTVWNNVLFTAITFPPATAKSPLLKETELWYIIPPHLSCVLLQQLNDLDALCN